MKLYSKLIQKEIILILTIVIIKYLNTINHNHAKKLRTINKYLSMKNITIYCVDIWKQNMWKLQGCRVRIPYV